MAQLIISSALVLMIVSLTSAYYIQSTKNFFILSSSNFTQGIKDSDIFVLFIEDPDNHEKFLKLWEEIGEVALTEEDSKTLKFGIVFCNNDRLLCSQYSIQRAIQLRFFGEKNRWNRMTIFMDSTIKDVLREDELIEKLKNKDVAGNIMMMCKVNYCPFCKEAMEEFAVVIQHYKNNPKVFVASLDCERHRDVCRAYGAIKYPRFRFIRNDGKGGQTIDNYEETTDDERTSASMIKYCDKLIAKY